MRKLLLLLVLAMFNTIAFAQSQVIETTPGSRNLPVIREGAFKTGKERATRPTTMEEYNYLTKGLKTQLEQGLDMKKGYEFKHKNTYNLGKFTVEVKDLVRQADNSLAGTSMIFHYSPGGGNIYVCVPVVDENGSPSEPDLLFNEMLYSNLTVDYRRAMQAALAARLSEITDYYYSTTK